MPVEVEILGYLAQHPDAKDTPQGIAEWWMLERGISPTANELKAALETLCRRGLITAEQAGDGRVYYCASAAKNRRNKSTVSKNEK